MTDTPQNIKVVIPKPKHMGSMEYQKRMKQLVKLLEILDIKVVARNYEDSKSDWYKDRG